MNKVNKVGLEAEFFLHNHKKELVYPEDYGFDCDDFVILGEFRAEPGNTREDTIANFIKELVKVRREAKENRLTLSYGYEEITPQFKSSIMKRIGSKNIQDTKNIYGTDILTCSDDVLENGKVISTKLSAGLHVHFSKEVCFERDIHQVIEGVNVKTTIKESQYLLTMQQIKGIVKAMDVRVYPNFTLPVELKYRQKGFYELKPYGFEYRSLPMIKDFEEISALENIVNTAFTMLEGLYV